MATHKGTGGKGLIKRGSGFDTAYDSDLVSANEVLIGAGYHHVLRIGDATEGDSLAGPASDGGVGDGRSGTGTLELQSTAPNTAPTAKPDGLKAEENGVVLADVLANDYDPDAGAVLTVIAASAPEGQGKASIVKNQVEFDPGGDLDGLAEGESLDVVIDYEIADEHGATDRSTVTMVVIGANDGPVANPDSGRTGENQAILVDVLANDTDVDHKAVLTVVAASVREGRGKVSVADNKIHFDPGAEFDHLAVGETAVVTLDYTIEDEFGAQSSATVTITVQASDRDSVNTGTDEGDRLFGTPDGDAIDALGGDDLVFGLAGDDVILGGDGNDFASGDSDNDVIDGGNHDDALMGGEGNDELLGQAGDDQLFGENGDDGLLGHEGDDSLDGGDGDDKLAGGDGDDSLSDFGGTNSLSGGAGHDHIAAGSADGAQRIDGGDGDDSIRHYLRYHASAITTGAGRDSIELVHANFGEAAIVVTDFTTGAEGDVFRLSGGEGSLLSLLSGWDGSSNPFSSGFLRLVQGEAGALLQWDRDGEGRDWDWETLVVFEKTDAGAFTAANFAPGFDPRGSAAEGEKIAGTREDDTLAGTIGDDLIESLDGHDLVDGGAGADRIGGEDGIDMLSGGSGNDVLDGGNHDDALSGGAGDDQLFGQEDNDDLSGDNGKDELSGGNGNDSLDGGEGDDWLLGDDGDDVLSDFGGANSLFGGAGDDQIAAGSAEGAQTIDAGDGNDTIRHYYRHEASAIATGSGRDSIELLHADLGKAAIVVTDFATGAEGDVLRLSGGDGALLSLLSGWDGSSNPFGSGFLRLEQGEAGALLQWDRDGEGRDWDWETLLVFEKTDAGAFIAANFAGYDPRGSAPAGVKIAGSKEDDTLTGTIGDDLIESLGGNDLVDGGAGADRISGDDGNDRLSGGTDNDVLDGGNDDDEMWGGDGKDQLAGQAGNDNLEGGNGDDQLSGGDGDDTLTDFGGANSLAGDLGDDHIFAGSSNGAQTIDGGDGNDTIRLHHRHHASTVTTGAGRDSIELVHANLGAAAIVVTDFTPGAGGDILRLSGGDGSLLSLLSGWDGNSNPFGSGFLRLRKSGADTLLQWDRDGAGTASGWETLVVFQNSYAGDFTGANFEPGFNPDGSAPGGEWITGTQEDDKLTGTIGADTIEALAGTDFAAGGSGADRIEGGDGADFLSGEADNDVLDGGVGDDVIWGGDGDDESSGQSGHDALFGENGDDLLTGGVGDDSLDGGGGDDSLVGGDGGDFLTGAAGSDSLTGGAGADFFNFQSAAHGADEIADFLSGSDRIRISAEAFGGGLVAGGSVSLISGTAPAPSRATGQFLYDTDDGRLLWDADGIGSGGAVLVATFANAPSLDASDFLVV